MPTTMTPAKTPTPAAAPPCTWPVDCLQPLLSFPPALSACGSAGHSADRSPVIDLSACFFHLPPRYHHARSTVITRGLLSSRAAYRILVLLGWSIACFWSLRLWFRQLCRPLGRSIACFWSFWPTVPVLSRAAYGNPRSWPPVYRLFLVLFGFRSALPLGPSIACLWSLLLSRSAGTPRGRTASSWRGQLLGS